MSKYPVSALNTQFGQHLIINLNDFIEALRIVPVKSPEDLTFITTISLGFQAFEVSSTKAFDISDFEKVSPKPATFYNIVHAKEEIAEQIKESVQRPGKVESLQKALLDYTENFGEATHIVAITSRLVMPVNFRDFEVRIFGDKFVFCYLCKARFKAYDFNLKEYLESIA